MVLIKARRIVKIGNSHYFNVPIQFIESEVIEKRKKYHIDVIEAV